MKRAILFLAFAAFCGAQTTVNGGRDYKGSLKASGGVATVDFSGAASTAPAKAGSLAARPAACTQGHIYFATDVAAGQNLYFCTTTGTPGVWTQMTGGSASAGITNAAYISPMLPGPDLTRTLAATVHGFQTAALIVAVYDNSSPREAINAAWSVNPWNYDVTITFATPQSDYYVVVNGGVGPAGPQGPAGPAGASGPGNRRTCIIDNDSQSVTPLTASQITGRCEIPFAAHITEVGVWGGTGTGTQHMRTTSVQLTRLRPNGGSTAPVLSGALPTPGSSANSNSTCAVAALNGTCLNGLPSSSSISLAGGTAMAVNAGDIVYVSSATPDGLQSWLTICINYTAD